MKIQILTSFLLLGLLCPLWSEETAPTPAVASAEAGDSAPSAEPAPAPAEEEGDVVKKEKDKPKPRLTPSLRKGSGEKGPQGPRSGLYLGGFGGVNAGDNAGIGAENNIAGATTQFEMENSSDLSFLGGFKLGYTHYSRDKGFDELQIVPSIELEFAYNNVQTSATGEGAVGAGSNLDLEMDVMTIMANAYVRLHNRVLVPYVGFGGGLAHVTLSSVSGSVSTESAATVLEDNQYVPVFQGIVGLEREIMTPNWTVFGEYRALFIPDATFDVALTGAAGNQSTLSLENLLLHQFAVGVRYHF